MSEAGVRTPLTRRPQYGWVVMGMSFLAVFGALGLGRYGYGAVLPEMQARLGLSGQQAGSLASWNLVGYVLLAGIGGMVASRFGTRRVVTTGMFVSALGMLLTGLSKGVVSASAARLLTGVGNGVVLVPSVALMSLWFAYHRRGLASAIVASGGALALVIAGPITPRLIASGGAEGWRVAWYVFAGIAFVLAMCSLLVMRDRPYQKAGPESHSSGPKRRLEWKRVFTSGYAWHLGLIYMLFAFSYGNYIVFFQKRLIDDLDFRAETAGNLYLILGAASLACGVIWGSASDRIGRRKAMVIMLTAQAVAAALFAFWPATSGLVISAIIFGLTAVGFAGVLGAACGDRFGAALAPASLGFVTLFAGVGQAVGPVIAGRMGDAFSSFAPAYALSAGLFVVSAVAALFLRSGGRERAGA